MILNSIGIYAVQSRDWILNSPTPVPHIYILVHLTALAKRTIHSRDNPPFPASPYIPPPRD